MANDPLVKMAPPSGNRLGLDYQLATELQLPHYKLVFSLHSLISGDFLYQDKATGGHNQLSRVRFPAIASFVFPSL